MGIKDYLKYLQLENPIEKSRIYDYVYLDCNYMCHYLIYKCKNNQDLYSKIFDYWEYLISTIKIKKELFLIFDGNYDTEDLANPKYQTHLLRAKTNTKTNSDDFDKQSIYPGSQILKTFREFLTSIIERNKKINKSNFKITTNSDEINGEADIKILNTIYNSEQNNICICSKDSDMILISQSLAIKKSINIDVLTNLRPIKFINIHNFNHYGLDYVLFVLLLGNDYLPKISNITYMKLINTYDIYIKYNEPIISNNQINTNNLLTFISLVIIHSDKNIKPNFDNINYDKFNIYFNNVLWCLKYYKAIDNSNVYIQELKHKNDQVKIKNVINIYNFINHNYI